MNSYLSHHGIDGQKWGKRNGPPYPLEKSVKKKSKTKRVGIKQQAKDMMNTTGIGMSYILRAGSDLMGAIDTETMRRGHQRADAMLTYYNKELSKID